MLSKGFGGAERYFVDLSRALAAGGHEVQAVCHARFVAQDRLTAQPGMRVDFVNARGMWDLWSVRVMERLVGDFAPDVIHAHLARGAWAGGKIARHIARPLIVKTHNYVNLKYYRGVDRFITTTRAQADYLRQSGVPEGRIERIANFSSIPPGEPATLARNDPVTYLSYGRHVTKKGFRVLLGAFARVRRQGLHAKLIIGGDGPRHKQLIALANRLQVADRVNFIGWVDDVSAFLELGDIFVLPSLDEPFGIAVLEAMARGRVIISTRTHGPVEVLDESTAFFAVTGDVSSLAGAMIDAAQNPSLSRRRATNALARYVSQYHRDAVLPRILQVYDSVSQSAY